MTFHPTRATDPGSGSTVGRSYGGPRSRRAAVAAGPSLLAACGGDDGGGGGGGGEAVQLSRPDNPVTLPTFDDIPAIADGLDPETGTLKIFNYAEYIAPRRSRGVRREYGVDGRGHDLHQHGRGRRQAVRGPSRLRPLLPDDRRHRQGRGGQAPAAAQRAYLAELVERLDPAPGPVLRRRGAVHRALHVYTTGIGYRIDRVAQAPGDVRQPVRHPLGSRRTPATCTCSRTTARCSGMAMLRAGRDRRQHRGPGA